ncbi:MAG: hypothetical protein RLZZ628_2102 [Bacteroidota bacterium]
MLTSPEPEGSLCHLCDKKHTKPYNKTYDPEKNFGLSWETFQQCIEGIQEKSNRDLMIDAMYYTDIPNRKKSITKKYLDTHRRKGVDETRIQLAAEETIEIICVHLMNKKICYGNLNAYFSRVFNNKLVGTPVDLSEIAERSWTPDEIEEDDRVDALLKCLEKLQASKQWLQAEVLKLLCGFESGLQNSKANKYKWVADALKITEGNARKLAERGRNFFKICMSKK